MSVALTDDEVVALGARAGRPWPTLTPTVDMLEESALSAAVERGARSLIVRGLLDQIDSVHRSLEDIIAPIIFGRPIFETYVAKQDEPEEPIGVVSFYFESDGAWTSETVSIVGIRNLRRMTKNDCLEEVKRFIVFAQKELEKSSGSVFCLAKHQTDGAILAVIDSSSILLRRVDRSEGQMESKISAQELCKILAL